jgi:hypothetical protein
MSAPLVILAAGGTGGHVFPAEALAGALAARGYRLALVTDDRGSAYGGTLGTLETHRLPIRKMTGNLLRRLIGAASLLPGFFAARRLLARLKPAAVVGFGGYPSLPTMFAAALKVRTTIHEQNAILGRVNRLVVLEPRERKGATFLVNTELRIGRTSNCAISIPDDAFVSQIHARVFTSEGTTWLEDLGSTNGTYLNGERVTNGVVLNKGDRIQIGASIWEAN